MKPRVCFITPPSIFLMDERVFVALGVLKVAAVAEHLGYGVEHLDLNGVENYVDAVLNHCEHTSARIFAITATTPQMPAVMEIGRALRLCFPMAKLVIGGPHPTLVYAALKKHYSTRAKFAADQLENLFNVIVAGDGEDAIDIALQTEAGVIDADDPQGMFFLTGQRLGELPFPARHLVDLESYHYTIDNVRVTGLISQLGCPFGCNFCAGRDSAMLRRVRLRPTGNVIEEMRHIYRAHGIHGFMFFDDELNVNRQMLELMSAIDGLQQELGVEFRCRGFVKAELFNEEQAQAMYRAGFRKIMCGFESGSERILRNINKHATRDDNSRAMDISHKHNLGMKALMSVGHPGESHESIRETIDWLLRVRPADFDVTIITAYPGSPYYDRSKCVYDGHDGGNPIWKFETNGDALYSYEIDYTQTADYYKGAPGDYRAYVFTDFLTPDDIVELRDVAEREVREKLQIPYYSAAAALHFEHAFGGGKLPPYILRTGGTQ